MSHAVGYTGNFSAGASSTYSRFRFSLTTARSATSLSSPSFTLLLLLLLLMQPSFPHHQQTVWLEMT